MNAYMNEFNEIFKIIQEYRWEKSNQKVHVYVQFTCSSVYFWLCWYLREIVVVQLRLEYIRSPQKFLSFYKEVVDAQHFLFYIILLNYVWSSLFYYYKMDHKSMK